MNSIRNNRKGGHALITFHNVCKTYEKQHVIKDFSLTIHEGELFVLIGPSGSGKTTTMKMINRLIEPTKGHITIKDNDIATLNPVALRRNIGYVIQQIGLLPHLTIQENVSLVPRLKQMAVEEYHARVQELMRMVALEPSTFAERYPHELSGGQQQRIGVIRALAADPDIILMDEPFSALDPISREQLQDELIRIQQELKKTIVFVTHDMNEALKLADRVGIMQNGHLVQVDAPQQLLAHPANDFVKTFVGNQHNAMLASLLPITQIMQPAHTMYAHQTIKEAQTFMLEHQLDMLIILDRQEIYMGSVTIWAIYQQHYDPETLLQDVIQSTVAVLSHSATIEDLTALLHVQTQPITPVLNRDQRVMGVINSTEAAAYIATL